MKTTVSEGRSGLKNDLKTELMNEVDQKMKENDEIAKRMDCLIFFNVPESSSDVVRERITYDNELIQKICMTTGAEDANISQSIRLGSKKSNEGKNRPLKVRFALKSERRTVLINSKNLAKSIDTVLSNVSIARDLTKSK